MRLRCGDGVHVAERRATARGLQIVVDGAAHAFEVEAAAPGVFILRDGPRRETFHCVRAGGRIHLFWRGAAYVLDEVSESERAPQRHDAHGLEAPMPGRVIAIKAEAGQAVSRGDEVLVVEAMKMENAIRAPHDGVVKKVLARVGDMVSPGMVLIEMED